jgi:cytoplasmic iron level regulating protein YaaA (DUF328/UPF0246 family)
MLFLLSPAKSLDYASPTPAPLWKKSTEPIFSDRAAELIALLRKKTPAQVASLMDLSDKLATLNVARYGAWQPLASAENSKPAALAFDGDVYGGLQAPTLKSADLVWAQQHLVILSGLYGVLRPLDRLQPYRLEMGTALKTRRGEDLYAYWGDTLSECLNRRQADDQAPVVVNLASVEYARAALRPALRARVVQCVFEEGHPGGWRIVSFHAKRARGLMARHAIVQRARSVKALESFEDEDYRLAREVSTPDRLVFRRQR